jgi:hypothetical protein
MPWKVVSTILGGVARAPDWAEIAARAGERYREGESRVDGIADPDVRQRQLTRLGNAAGAVGLSRLAAGEPGADEWLLRAAERYRESWEHAPPGSWGRPIGAIKSRLLAGDQDGAARDAAWALDAGAAGDPSPIGGYAAVLALLVVGRDGEAGAVAERLRGRDDFPRAVADGLAALARRDAPAYTEAARAVLVSFEQREEYLEDVPLADTVLVLQLLAARRDMAAQLPPSALMP